MTIRQSTLRPIGVTPSTNTKANPYHLILSLGPPLPTGWKMGILRETGKAWFWNQTRRPQSLDPPIIQGQILVAHEALFTEPLPKGWEPGVTEEGRVYYSNYNILPRVPKAG
jgi:hypothetical protein